MEKQKGINQIAEITCYLDATIRSGLYDHFQSYRWKKRKHAAH